MTEPAEELFKSATQLAKRFIEMQCEMDNPTWVVVALKNDESTVQTFKTLDRLTIHFLFPNGDEECRWRLLKIAWYRRALELCNNRPESEKHLLIEEWKNAIDGIDDMIDQMLPVQEEIFMEKYLTNPFA